MNVSLKVTYRTVWLPLVCEFVAETARALGANDSERSRLHLAAEETALHIMESIPHDELEDAFEVTCVPHPEGVEYVFNNLGPPVDVAALPIYDRETPEAHIEGLQLFLARRMVDRLEFVNRGHEGWRTTFYSRLAAMSPMAAEESSPFCAEVEPEPMPAAEPVTSLVATPHDAFEIVQMAYHNYRYSYAKESFYFAEQLQAELASGHVVSFIARARSGPIVGHLAFFKNDASPGVYEVGAVMVRPDYRRSRALLVLLKTALRYQAESSEVLDHYTSNLVTAHTLSQKLAATMGLKPMALNVSTHPRAKFLGLHTGEGRESNLYAISVQRPLPPVPLAVPPEHSALAAKLFSNLGLVTDPDGPAREAATVSGPPCWVSTCDERAKYATLAVDSYCSEFAHSLRAEVYRLSQEKVDTLSLRLPAWLPLPADLDEELARQSFFFCGFIHLNGPRWQLAYARLMQQHFTFDDILVFDSVAEELKAYVSRCHQKLISSS